ncbi:hypothetical protein, partial [Alistipes finegoldii]
FNISIMKTILKSLSIIILVVAMAGCAAQKGGNKADTFGSEALYIQALNALKNRDFIIKINEFYFPSDKAPVNSTNSYVSMQGNHAVIRMSQDFPSAFSSNRDTESDAVEISDGERKRKGNMQFHMKIKGAEKWQDKELIIILYNNTNQCFVRLHGGYAGVNVINFKGHIYPMAEVIKK